MLVAEGDSVYDGANVNKRQRRRLAPGSGAGYVSAPAGGLSFVRFAEAYDSLAPFVRRFAIVGRRLRDASATTQQTQGRFNFFAHRLRRRCRRLPAVRPSKAHPSQPSSGSVQPRTRRIVSATPQRTPSPFASERQSNCAAFRDGR